MVSAPPGDYSRGLHWCKASLRRLAMDCPGLPQIVRAGGLRSHVARDFSRRAGSARRATPLRPQPRPAAGLSEVALEQVEVGGVYNVVIVEIGPGVVADLAVGLAEGALQHGEV